MDELFGDIAAPQGPVRVVSQPAKGCSVEHLQRMRRTIEVAGQLRDEDVSADVLDAFVLAFAEQGPGRRS